MAEDHAMVSAIIPVKDDAARAMRAVEGLRRELRDVEVVIVDNDPSAPSEELAQVADHYVVAGGSVGAARMAGLGVASRPVILFLDADQQLLPGRLRRALRLLGTSDAVVLAERSANPGLWAKVLDAERALTEWAGLGIPRLFRRSVLLDLLDDDAISTMVFGEDSYLASRVGSVRLASEPVLLHDDPKSVHTLLEKYVAYGRRAAHQVGGSGVRRRRHPTGARMTTVTGQLPWLTLVGALKVGKAVAYSYGRLAGLATG